MKTPISRQAALASGIRASAIWKGMEHSRPYLEFCLSAGGKRLLINSEGIVIEHLILAHMDQHGRQIGKITKGGGKDRGPSDPDPPHRLG